MAKATKQTITDRKTVVVEPEKVIPAVTKEVIEEKTTVTLTLTQAEAEFLHVLLPRIGGSPRYSPRKYADSIKTALWNAGVAYEPDHYAVENEVAWRGALFFKDYPKVPKGKLAAPHVPSVAGVVPKVSRCGSALEVIG